MKRTFLFMIFPPLISLKSKRGGQVRRRRQRGHPQLLRNRPLLEERKLLLRDKSHRTEKGDRHLFPVDKDLFSILRKKASVPVPLKINSS